MSVVCVVSNYLYYLYCISCITSQTGCDCTLYLVCACIVSTELCTVETVTVLLRYHNILMIPLTLN